MNGAQVQSYCKAAKFPIKSSQSYEVKIATLLFLRGVSKTQGFFLASNIQCAGIFCDITLKCVYKISDGEKVTNKIWFIQLRHDETVEIMQENFFFSSDNFSLLRSFHSFYNIKTNCESDKDLSFLGKFDDFEFVIYTNAVLPDDLIRQTTHDCSYQDNILNSKDNNSFILSFHDSSNILQAFEDLILYKTSLDELMLTYNDSSDDVIKEKIDTLTKSIKTKEIVNKLCKLQTTTTFKSDLDMSVNELGDVVGDISEYGVFLSKTNVFMGQSLGHELDELIMKEIQQSCHVSNLGAHLLYNKLLNEVATWWNTQSYYLTENAKIWSNIMSSIPQACDISRSHLIIINKLEVKFFTSPTNEVRNLILNSKISNIIAEGAELILSTLKVYQVVESLFHQRYIFVSLELLINLQSEILMLWPSKWYPVLVVVCESVSIETGKLFSQLLSVLSSEEAKIVLISTEGNPFPQYFKHKMNNNYSEILDKSKLIHLDDRSQQHILGKKVEFQGHMVSIGCLVNNYSELKDNLDTPILSKLLSDTDKFEIGNHLAPINFYLPRTLECYIPIQNTVLKASTFFSSVFAISNITIAELKQLMVHKEEICLFDYVTPINTECRLFILTLSSSVNVFEMLCSHFPHKTVHHLMFDGNVLVWKESKGDPVCLRDYICREKITSDPGSVIEYMVTNLKSTHCPQSMLDIINDLVVLVADPGMGKSSLLTTLSHQTKVKDPHTWIIYVNLNSHTDFFAETKVEDFNTTKALELLHASFKDEKRNVSNFECVLLKHSLQNKGNIIILLDGFDEISPLYTEKCLSLITVLRRTQVKKLWITSQPGMKNKLVSSLNVMPYELQPLTHSLQRDLFLQLWSHKFSNIDLELIDLFIIKVQSLLKKSLCIKSKEIGIALQIIMLAEVLEDQLTDFISNNSLDLPKPFTSFQLYDKFVDKKFEIHTQWKELSKTEPNMKYNYEISSDMFKTMHMLCAMFVLFDDTEVNELQIQPILEKVPVLMREVSETCEQTGMLYEVISGRPHFIHHTFAEYFAGMWFSRNFSKCRQFIIHRMFDPSFSTIKHFFDWFLVREHDLHIAVMNNDSDTVSYLLDSGVDVNDRDQGGRTPLHLAVVYGKPLTSEQPKKHIEERDAYDNITKLLVDHTANVKMIDDILYWRPIHYATMLKRWDALDLVLKDQVDMNELSHMKQKLEDKHFLQEGLIMTCEKGYYNLIECFLLCGVDINSNIIEHKEGLYNPIHLACRYGQLKLVRCLLSKKIKISICDKKGNTPLHYAVREGMLEVVLYLVQKGADINACDKEGNTPLNLVACTGDLQIAFFLVEHLGCNINLENKYGDTPLHRAAGSRHGPLVEYLLEWGASVNVKNKEGNTPLHRVVWMGNLSMTQVLLENGADVNICNNNGDTPLSQSAGGGRWDIIQCLVENGADIMAIAEDGNTALHWAARQNNVEVLSYLIDKGANINACNRYGNTALHRAVEHGNFEAVHYLTSKGSDVNISNNAGYTADTIRARKV